MTKVDLLYFGIIRTNQYVNSAVYYDYYTASQQIKLFGHTEQLFNYFELRTQMIEPHEKDNKMTTSQYPNYTIEWNKQDSIE